MARHAASRAQVVATGLLADAPIGLGAVDADLRFLWVNAALASISGRPASDHVGREVREVFGALADRLEPLLRRVLETGETVSSPDLCGPASRGEERSFGVTLYPLRCAEGIHGVGGVVQETTAQRRALAARDEFLTIAAHELKSPITAVLGYGQQGLRRLDRHDDLPREESRRLLRGIERQAQRLARLVGQLLDVSRIQNAQLSIEPSWIELAALARSVVDAAQDQTGRHAVTLFAEREVQARVDAVRIEQVLTNLVENAVKYSPQGGPVEVEVDEPRAGAVRIVVSDRGEGLRGDVRERVFDRFFKVDAGQRSAGMGLGLYIAREIVERHGGTIRADLRAGGGTRFVVDLPKDALARD